MSKLLEKSYNKGVFDKMSLNQYYPTDIQVGEIVIMHPRHDGRKRKHPLDGFKAFVEEIVHEPTPINQLKSYNKTKGAIVFHSGTYSLYGFKENELYGRKDWYIGDMKGVDFERTHKLITIFELNKIYDRVGKKDHMFSHDIKTVINNLGRTHGRNE